MAARRGSVPGRVSHTGMRAGARRGGANARVQVSEMQRSRLLGAAVATIEELGWSGASVAHITARARISRRTFYDLFDNREDCLLAVMEDILGQIEGELAATDLGALSWHEHVRTGLWTILCFFDREPALARVCVMQALQGGPRVLARREEILARLAGVVDEGRGEHSRAGECPPLTAEGLVGATFSIVHARLSPSGWGGASRSSARGASRTGYVSEQGRRPIVRDRPAPPVAALLGELMGMIVLPYLGVAAARREQDRPVPPLPAPTPGAEDAGIRAMAEHDPLAGVPMRLTYRTARVLETLAERPGASNRLAADLAGVSDQGQISKLLARLERLGLIENTGEGHAKGEPNAWRLTALGRRVAQQLSVNGRNWREDV